MRTFVSVRVGGDQPGGFESVHLGHADVHQDHVGPLTLGDLDGFVAVGCFADHLDAVFGSEQREETAADEGLVVGDRDSDRSGHRATLTASTSTC